MSDSSLRVSSPNAIKHRSIADATADALRRMVLLGELQPGSKVTQEDLSSILGVSTMPIREALLRLASEGLIETSPNRSFRVVTMTQDDIRDIYWIQAVITGELTRRACLNGTPDEIAELHAIQTEFDSAERQGAIESMEAANWRFHRRMNQIAASTRLLIALQLTLRYVPAGLYPRIAEWANETKRGHRLILDALDAGDADTAGVEAQRHVIEAGELLVKTFFERGYWDTAQTPSNGAPAKKPGRSAPK